jgi:hypothetical protein
MHFVWKPLLPTFVSLLGNSSAPASGVEAQRTTITRFAEVENLQITAEYVEAETGRAPTRSIAALTLPQRWQLPRTRNASWSQSSTGSLAMSRSLLAIWHSACRSCSNSPVFLSIPGLRAR